MFHGTHPDVIRAYGEASRLARTLGHPRVGSEHLLCALAGAPGPTGDLLRAGGLTPGRLAAVLDGLDGVSAAVVADVVQATALGWESAGVDLRGLSPSAPRHRILPLGWRRAQARAEAACPPIGGDAQAASEAALRLALAQWHRHLELHHLAEVLLAWDRGARLVAARAGVDPAGRVAALREAAPPRRRVRRHLVRQAAALVTS